jgi:diguanylate cyclase (GGDEF)-like protein
LKTLDIKEVLNQLVQLTLIQDESTLESQLIGVLTQLIKPTNQATSESTYIAIYNIKNIEKQIFSMLSPTEFTPEATLDSSLKQALLKVYQSGECVYNKLSDQTYSNLYPIKDYTEKVVSIVELRLDGAPDSDVNLQRESIITTILQLYQNFTKLMNDNERDTLTGLLNRKTFDKKINKTILQMQSGAKRKDDSSTNFFFLAIFDIDHFKRVNDNFGHLIGDEVLLLFSQLLQQSFRDTDPLFRFGGEEFVGVYACKEAHDIDVILNRFRQKVEAFSFPQVGNVTVSAGYTAIAEYDNPSQMVERADAALYFAKNNGRNRVECHEKLIESGQLQVNVIEGDIELF